MSIGANVRGFAEKVFSGQMTLGSTQPSGGNRVLTSSRWPRLPLKALTIEIIGTIFLTETGR